MTNEKFNDALPRLELIAYSTKLRISRAKEFKIIQALDKRMVFEEKRQRPGFDIIEKQNAHSLYLTQRAFYVLNTTS